MAKRKQQAFHDHSAQYTAPEYVLELQRLGYDVLDMGGEPYRVRQLDVRVEGRNGELKFAAAR